MTDPHLEPQIGSLSLLLSRVVSRYGIIVAFLILFIAVALGSPSFLSVKNFTNILSQWTPIGIMAVGATYVILAGGFDLSAASGFALCSIVAAVLATKGFPPTLSLLSAMGVGILIGIFNGLIVVGLKVNPFIATLGSAFVLSGIPHVIADRTYIIVRQPGFDALGTGAFLGVPYSGICLLAILIFAGVVLAKTPYGLWLYAVGGNPDVSRLFGIRVRLVSASTYVFSGFCMGAAAAISTSQLSYSASDHDPALIFDVIVAVVVGGTSLSGGFGSIWRTAVGLAILATLQNGLNLLQINSAGQYIIKGFIIVGAIAVDAWSRRATWQRGSRLSGMVIELQASAGARATT
jgi:ribose transport system permease protein